MTARPATREDTPRIIDMLRELFRYANRRGDFNQESVRAMMDHLRENGILIVSDKGVIGGVVIPLWPTGEMFAQEIVSWGDLALVASFEESAREMGATAIHLKALTERVGKHYERRGYRKVESMYLKEFQL